MWQHLIETALLGTEKKTLNPEVLPAEIRGSFNQSKADPEQSFLETAAQYCFYLEAGKQPSPFKGDIDERIIEETLLVASSHFNDIFKQLDTVHLRLKEKLYNLWLDNIIKKQLIVAPDIVIQLLNRGESFSEATKSKILKVIGNKGNWILSLHSGLQYNQISKEDIVWAEGNTTERKSILLKHLKADAQAAISLLQSTWSEEPLVNKRIFLELIKDYRVQSVISFAESLYNGEFAFNPKEKKTEKECRRLVVEILLRSKETSLHQSAVEKLTRYFDTEKKKGLLGFVSSKPQTDYKLPEGEDDFWNAATMEQLYGLEVKNYDISLFQSINQFWLAYFLTHIPAEAWIKAPLNSYADFLNCFLDKDEFKLKADGKTSPVFLKAIMLNAASFENNQLALELISRIPATIALPLLKYIKSDEFEQFVRKNKYYDDAELLQNGPYSMEESWSLAFSEAVLSAIYEKATQASASNLDVMGMVLSQYLHTDVYNTLQKFHEKANTTSFYYQWNTFIYEPVNAILLIRRLIKSSNN